MTRSRLPAAGAICALLFGLVALVLLSGAGRAGAQTRNFGWQKVQGTPGDVDLTGVFVISGRLGGLVTGKQGDHGVLYDLDITPAGGSSFSVGLTTIKGGTFRAPLNDAVLLYDDTVWAVGDSGLIVHRTASGWAEIASPVPGANLTAVQMLGDGSEGWAAGYLPGPNSTSSPVLLHYTHGQWQRDTSITGQGRINALHFGAGPGGERPAGWVAGQVGIWRYSNGEWNKEQEPEPCPNTHCFATYTSVRAINGDEAWIAGSRMGICGICVPQPYILHRVSGHWQDVLGIDGILNDPTLPNYGRELNSITFADPGHGWVVGDVRQGAALKPYIAYYDVSDVSTHGRWTYTSIPEGDGALLSVGAVEVDHAVAVGTNGLLYTFGYGQQPAGPTATPINTSGTPTATPQPGGGSNPTQRVPDPHDPNVTYFSLVGHTLRGGFRDYWQRHGGLEQFGYPLTEEFTEVSPTNGKPYVTQYFERARFEYHPENRSPYDVLLGLLGRTITQGREQEQPFQRTPAQVGGPAELYFEATGHNMAPQFAAYWQTHGGLPVYGYPISEPFTEVSPTDGKAYLVQYFERNRLEYHPELPQAFRVSLGLLGVQVLQQRGWIAK